MLNRYKTLVLCTARNKIINFAPSLRMPLRSLRLNFLYNILLLFFLPALSSAQHYDTVSVFKLPVQLDYIIIKSGFDIDAFIHRVQTDTTFYKAFKSMDIVPYTAVNDIKAYDNEGKIKASLYSKTKQKIHNGCRSMKVQEEKVTGDMYKRNGSYNYYTAELYAYLFFTKDTICDDNDIVANSLNEHGKGQMEKNKYQLKQLIFNPGSKISGIPLMGDKASIFDPAVAKNYDFKVYPDNYEGQDCYVFKATPKPGQEHKVVYNELTTWFRKNDYAIVARNYSLSFNTMFYDFDVHIKVRTEQINGKLYPTFIDYDGNWHVFSKKRERVRFIMRATY